jgi:hypothetical protein
MWRKVGGGGLLTINNKGARSKKKSGLLKGRKEEDENKIDYKAYLVKAETVAT